MKKLRLWIKSLSLVQQFICVAIITVITFAVFNNFFLNVSINAFVNQQMLNYLDRYQNNFIKANSSAEFVYSDANVSSYVYSISRDTYLETVEDNADFLKNIDPNAEDTSGVKIVDGKTYVYSIRHFSDDQFVLVSIISQNYIYEFKTALENGVIGLTFRVIIGLFFLFLLWVFSIITPLNQIRHYINKIRVGENAELNISRNDEIGELAEALKDMNTEISKNQRTKEELIQNISHDLKTPIAIIKSYSESIKDGIYPYGTLEKSVDIIIDNANRLEKKVYNLNTFNKLEYLKDSDDETNMFKVINDSILSVEAIRNDIKVKANLDKDVMFHGTEDAWLTVVENLLDNALRYARKKVIINLEPESLEIINDGEQMSQERIDKLFKPYEKGNKGNFGLGLSIVKKTCDTYGYNVVGENMDDGVVFRIYTTKKKTRAKKKTKTK